MKNLYFGLMCVLDSMMLFMITVALTVAAYGPLDSFFGSTTMWEEIGTGLAALILVLLIESAVIAIVKVSLEKKDEKAPDSK